MIQEARMKYEPDSSYVNQRFYDWLVELSTDFGIALTDAQRL